MPGTSMTMNSPGHSPASGWFTVDAYSVVDWLFFPICYMLLLPESCPGFSPSALSIYIVLFLVFPRSYSLCTSKSSFPFVFPYFWNTFSFFSMIIYTVYLDYSYLRFRFHVRHYCIWKVFADTQSRCGSDACPWTLFFLPLALRASC